MTAALAARAYRPLQPALADQGPHGLAYRELAPPDALADDLVCFWEIAAPRALPATFDYRIAPDGCVDLVFDLAGGGAWVYGAQDAPMAADLAGTVALLGIRVRPGRLAALLGHPGAAVAGASHELRDVLGGAIAGWADELASSRAPAERARRAAARLLAGRRRARPDERAGAAAAAAVVAHALAAPAAGVEAAARSSGVSARHLQRLCRQATGLAPKRLARVVRFQSALRRLTAPGAGSLAAIAVDAGFFDQAHLTFEVGRLLGTTPGALRRAALSGISNPEPVATG